MNTSRVMMELMQEQQAEIEHLRAELGVMSAANSKILEENKELSVAAIESRLELAALRKQEPVALSEMLADVREVFDASGSETPQVVRDVIEYVASWGMDKSRAAGGPSAPSVPDVDSIVDLMSEFATHDIERGKMEFDKWTLREAVEAAITEAPKRKPLTDDEVFEIASPFGCFEYGDAQGHKRIEFARAVEAAHGIGDEA